LDNSAVTIVEKSLLSHVSQQVVPVMPLRQEEPDTENEKMTNLNMEFTGLTPLVTPNMQETRALEKNQWSWEVRLFADASHIPGYGVAML
jgi:hydroxymethylpyrimidine/phosphomethylpyrimidine kinase